MADPVFSDSPGGGGGGGIYILLVNTPVFNECTSF